MQALDGDNSVCCDLGRVDFFGAAACNTVLAAHLHAADVGRRFYVRGVHGITAQVLAATGLDEILTFGWNEGHRPCAPVRTTPALIRTPL